MVYVCGREERVTDGQERDGRVDLGLNDLERCRPLGEDNQLERAHSGHVNMILLPS